MVYVQYKAAKSAIVGSGPAGDSACDNENGPQKIIFNETRSIQCLHNNACSVVKEGTFGLKVFRWYLIVIDGKCLNGFQIGLRFVAIL